jgi:oxazoline/thiazoline synthase
MTDRAGGARCAFENSKDRLRNDVSNPLNRAGRHDAIAFTHPFVLGAEQPAGGTAGLRLEVRPFDARKQVASVRLAQQAGVDFLVLDQTRPDIEAPVVRVIVPGLRHLYRGFAPGRVYNVPVNLRWRDRPLSEHELNAIHPNT